MSGFQRLLLIGLVVAAIFTITPLAIAYSLAYAWIALPLLLAWIGFLWFVGWRWMSDDYDKGEAAPLGVHLFWTAVALFWSLVGFAFLAYLAMLAIEHWVAVVATFLFLGGFIGIGLAWDAHDQRAKRKGGAAKPSGHAHRSKPDDIVT